MAWASSLVLIVAPLFVPLAAFAQEKAPTAEPTRGEPPSSPPTAEPTRGEPPSSPPTAEPSPDGGGEPREKPPTATPEGEGAERREAGERRAGEEGKDEEEEPPWAVNVDVVQGFGTLAVLTPGPPGTVPPANVFDSTRIATTSIMAGIARHLGERVEVGARIPFMIGSLSSRSDFVDSRTRALFGNLELEGVVLLLKRHGIEVEGGLELALPTGGGSEEPLPAEVAADKDKRFAYSSIERGAIAKVTEWSRGSYESALFEPDRIGIIPRVGARLRFGRLTLRPAVKVENLVDVSGDAPEKYIGELVAGLRASFRVVEFLEPGVHFWTNITYTRHEGRDLDVGVLSPFIRFPLGRVTPEIAAIIPVFGELVDAKAFGLRAAVNANF